MKKNANTVLAGMRGGGVVIVVLGLLSGLSVTGATAKMTSQLINPKVTEVDVSVHTNSVLVRLASFDRPGEVFGLRFADGYTMATFCQELVAEVMKQLKGAQDAEEAGKVEGAGSGVGKVG